MDILPGTGVDVGITARDPARMVRFYRDHLRMPLVRELDWPEHGSHVWFFGCGDSHVKIVSHRSLPAAANPPGGHADAAGLRYLAFHVRSIVASLEGLEAAGGSLQAPPATHGSVRVVFICDPEGNSLELIEDLPAA